MEKYFLKNDLGIKIDDYKFNGLKNSLNIEPLKIVEKIKESNLKGRGGAGFPTGVKWEYANKIKSTSKIVICNGDEGEPGTFKDRFLMENLPYKVIEGIVICAYAVKARYGYIYIRGEYEKAIENIEKTIKYMYKNHFLGKNIFDSNFDFDVKLIKGAGAYVCGDETSLINSIEGERGRSRIKPPLPIEKGLYEQPTIVNNVESLSSAAEIMKYDDNPYLKMGTENSRGTKLISISGDVNDPDVYEIEFGSLTIKEIIELAGGVRGNRVGIVIPGGIATECLTEDELNTKYTYEDLEKIGSSLGSGGMIVINNQRNLFEIIKNVSDFFKNETCGTCFPCREGNKNINVILEKVLNENIITEEETKLINEIKEAIGLAARCGFGRSSVNLILSILNKKLLKKVIL
ncbi:complex I 51 kDa subunit family protein [Geotoga petraea]|jgi:NADH-quinone oxidoreductase subunit F|uniref:NADH dehydrogenase FAD-containing subunit n=1 Tax=Geotoga petraea TaxID=28234 RepID=A0A4Z0VWE8_9BACT|nr:NADH-ubiquinone oxidoreductase-F iron-sulfur binding region domain-containing protein [Geotoga petraea]MDK2945571.1 NADH-quinone oxidoreductase subunit [Geotoga sp.]TGG88371.1 NADH dehydrogenase FAD-containing subunit [Geotoga petraea]